jgi:hypothetical protein
MKLKSMAAGVAATLILVACGGGGGDKPEPAATPQDTKVVASTSPFPIDSAITVFKQTAHSYTLTGTDVFGANYSVAYSTTPESAPAMFEGQVASTAMTTVAVTKNGVLTSNVASRVYFKSSRYLELGQVDTDGSNYYVDDVSSPLYLPTTATVGQSGPLNSTTVYADQSKASTIAHQTNSWSLEADTASTAWLCSTSVYTPVSPSGSSSTEKQCLRIDTSGVVQGMTVTLSGGGVSLVLQ